MFTHKIFIRFMKDHLFFLSLLLGVFLFQNALTVQNGPVSDGFLAISAAQNDGAAAGDDDDDDAAAGDDDDDDDSETGDDDDDDAETGDDDDDDAETGDDDDDDAEADGDDDDDAKAGDDETPKSKMRIGNEGPDKEEMLLEQYENKALYDTKKYQYGDASIREILSKKPTTVLELVEAARNFANLSRFDLANLFYKKAMEAGPTPEDVTTLVTNYGRAFFATLSENPNLEPSGNAFGKFVLQELEKRFSTDPEFIKQMIDQLSSPDEQERKVALTELLTYQSISLPALLDAYGKLDPEKDAKKVQTLQIALQNFGDALVGGLGAQLDSGDPKRLAPTCRLLKVLAEKKNRDALLLLLCAAVTNGKDHELSPEVMRYLEPLFKSKKMMKAQISAILKNQIAVIQKEKQALETSGNDDSVLVVWRWNPETKTIFPTTANRLVKYRQDSSRFARAFWELYPADPESRKLFFMTTSEYVITFMDGFTETELKTDQIIKTPEFQKLKEEFSVEETESFLTECLKSNFYDAAILAVLALGEKGDETLLQPVAVRQNLKRDPLLYVENSENFAPIVEALQTSNRFLRFASLRTIMKLNPQEAFPGSSRVMETLAWFLSTTGRSKVLIGARSSVDATILGGRFFEYGFNFDVGTNIKEILGKAIASCDYSVILMNVELFSTQADLLLQQLQLDARTADIPIILLAYPDDFKTAEQLARKIPKCIWFPIPARNEDLELLISVINRIKTTMNVTPEQRVVQTRAALVWAGEIMRSHQSGWIERLPMRTSEQETSILEDVAANETVKSAEEAKVEKSPEEKAEEEINASLEEAKKRQPVNLLTEIKTDNHPGLAINWGKPASLYDVTPLITPVLKLYFYPEFLKESLEVLRWIGSPRAQESLAFIGTSGTFSYSASKRAARLLRESILRYGVLMSTKSIGEFYDLYNNTPAEKEKLLEVRGLVLDALEAPLNSKSQPDSTLDEKEPEEVEEADSDSEAKPDSEEAAEDDSEDEEEMEEEEEDSADDEEMEDEEEDVQDDELETVDEDELEADELEADEPKANEPKADEPEANEPKADEPKADEPEANEPEANEPEADEKPVELSDEELGELEGALDQELEPLD